MQKYWIIFASFLLLSLGHVPLQIARLLQQQTMAIRKWVLR